MEAKGDRKNGRNTNHDASSKTIVYAITQSRSLTLKTMVEIVVRVHVHKRIITRLCIKISSSKK